MFLNFPQCPGKTIRDLRIQITFIPDRMKDKGHSLSLYVNVSSSLSLWHSFYRPHPPSPLSFLLFLPVQIWFCKRTKLYILRLQKNAPPPNFPSSFSSARTNFDVWEASLFHSLAQTHKDYFLFLIVSNFLHILQRRSLSWSFTVYLWFIYHN